MIFRKKLESGIFYFLKSYAQDKLLSVILNKLFNFRRVYVVRYISPSEMAKCESNVERETSVYRESSF